jgi:hypothetical protein
MQHLAELLKNLVTFSKATELGTSILMEIGEITFVS